MSIGSPSLSSSYSYSKSSFRAFLADSQDKTKLVGCVGRENPWVLVARVGVVVDVAGRKAVSVDDDDGRCCRGAAPKNAAAACGRSEAARRSSAAAVVEVVLLINRGVMMMKTDLLVLGLISSGGLSDGGLLLAKE